MCSSDLAVFVEVVKARSFRRAAETIGMPNSTLSRRISGLEKAIGLRLLHRMSAAEASQWTLHTAGQTVEVPVGGRFLLNSIGMIRRLATLDLGIAMLAEEIVAEDLAEGRLRRVLPQWQATPISVHAITETRLLPAKTQRFIEFLRECLEQA